MSYPKWLYHPAKEAVIVPDEAAHKALGAGWVESPADFPPKVEPKSEVEPKEEKHHAKKVK